MNRGRARRRITGSRGLLVILGTAVGHHFNARSDPVAVALRSLQLDLQPMITAWAFIHPDFRRSLERGYNHIDTAIPIEIADSRSTVPRGGREVSPASEVNAANFMPPKLRKTVVGRSTVMPGA